MRAVTRQPSLTSVYTNMMMHHSLGFCTSSYDLVLMLLALCYLILPCCRCCLIGQLHGRRRGNQTTLSLGQVIGCDKLIDQTESQFENNILVLVQEEHLLDYLMAL